MHNLHQNNTPIPKDDVAKMIRSGEFASLNCHMISASCLVMCNQETYLLKEKLFRSVAKRGVSKFITKAHLVYTDVSTQIVSMAVNNHL